MVGIANGVGQEAVHQATITTQITTKQTMKKTADVIVASEKKQLAQRLNASVSEFQCTSKFYPSRRSSKMIAAMKTNKTHAYTHTQSQIRHTQRKREKMTESLQ